LAESFALKGAEKKILLLLCVHEAE